MGAQGKFQVERAGAERKGGWGGLGRGHSAAAQPQTPLCILCVGFTAAEQQKAAACEVSAAACALT